MPFYMSCLLWWVNLLTNKGSPLFPTSGVKASSSVCRVFTAAPLMLHGGLIPITVHTSRQCHSATASAVIGKAAKNAAKQTLNQNQYLSTSIQERKNTSCCNNSMLCYPHEERVSNKQYKHMTLGRPGLHILVFSHQVGYQVSVTVIPEAWGSQMPRGFPAKGERALLTEQEPVQVGLAICLVRGGTLAWSNCLSRIFECAYDVFQKHCVLCVWKLFSKFLLLCCDSGLFYLICT